MPRLLVRRGWRGQRRFDVGVVQGSGGVCDRNGALFAILASKNGLITRFDQRRLSKHEENISMGPIHWLLLTNKTRF